MRFYVSPDSVFPDENTIKIKDASELRHIRDVMRLDKGATVNVFDGQGREYTGEIKDVTKTSIVIHIKDIAAYKYKILYNLTLYQALPKKAKMDFIVEKATELGAERITPILTERVISAVKDRSDVKVDRWKRIVKAASKQCGRTRLPAVSDIRGFSEALSEAKKYDLVIFAALDKDAKPLKAILRDIKPKNIAVFVGPEGDFSPWEISMAKESGFKISSLGTHVLRLETAAVYILSCISYEFSAGI